MGSAVDAIARAFADAIGFLNEHQGALMLLTTVAYAVFTLLLVRESQAARASALLVARPRLWPRNESVVAVYLENFGPATARRVELRFLWRRPNGSQAADETTIHLPALAPGDRQPYMPDLVLPRDAKGELGLPSVADQRLTLEIAWKWSDARRTWLGSGRRHSDSLVVDMAAFRDSVHGEPNIVEPDAVDRLVEATREIVRSQEQRKWLDSPTGMPPEVRVHLEADAVRERWKLWKARFKYWILRRGQ